MNNDMQEVPLDLTRAILGAAICVHRELGPGLLESTYQSCLVDQLKQDGMAVEVETVIPIRYKGRAIDGSYRADVVVNGKVLLELKAVDAISPLHKAQTLTYLRHAGLKVGLLINFNVPRLMSGVHRFIR
jgi:GxxExxY protein